MPLRLRTCLSKLFETIIKYKLYKRCMHLQSFRKVRNPYNLGIFISTAILYFYLLIRIHITIKRNNLCNKFISNTQVLSYNWRFRFAFLLSETFWLKVFWASLSALKMVAWLMPTGVTSRLSKLGGVTQTVLVVGVQIVVPMESEAGRLWCRCISCLFSELLITLCMKASASFLSRASSLSNFAFSLCKSAVFMVTSKSPDFASMPAVRANLALLELSTL